MPPSEEAALTVKDARVSELMDEMTKHRQIGIAAMRSGMDRKTARKFAEIVSFTSQENARSIRVMERIGMRPDHDGDFDHPRVPAGHRLRRHVLYRIRRPAPG